MKLDKFKSYVNTNEKQNHIVTIYFPPLLVVIKWDYEMFNM